MIVKALLRQTHSTSRWKITDSSCRLRLNVSQRSDLLTVQVSRLLWIAISSTACPLMKVVWWQQDYIWNQFLSLFVTHSLLKKDSSYQSCVNYVSSSSKDKKNWPKAKPLGDSRTNQFVMSVTSKSALWSYKYVVWWIIWHLDDLGWTVWHTNNSLMILNHIKCAKGSQDLEMVLKVKTLGLFCSALKNYDSFQWSAIN